MTSNSLAWSSLEMSSLLSFVTSESACEMGTLSSTSKLPIPGAKWLFKVQLKFLSQALSISSLAKVPKNPAWVWTCTILRLLLVLFGKVLAPTFSRPPPRCLRVRDHRDRKGQPEGENDPLRRYQRSGHSTTLHGHDLRHNDHVKTLPLFADIDVRCPKYTFSHPAGLLFATQFAQIALVVTEKAAFEDMHVKGFGKQLQWCAW
jgi:hypothetical protein